MTGRLYRLIRGTVRIMALYLSAVPPIWVILNPLLYIMFLPLGLHFVMTLPWPILNDVPDPFGRGTSLYFLTYLYLGSIDDQWSPLWYIVEKILLVSGACLFLWSFALWLRSHGKLVTSGPYRVVRHPQYLGMIIAVLGLSMQAARPIALISWGAMTYTYVLMAYLEDRSLIGIFGGEHANYRAETWFMLPVPRVLNRRLGHFRPMVLVLVATTILVAYVLLVIYLSPNCVVSLRGITFQLPSWLQHLWSRLDNIEQHEGRSKG